MPAPTWTLGRSKQIGSHPDTIELLELFFSMLTIVEVMKQLSFWSAGIYSSIWSVMGRVHTMRVIILVIAGIVVTDGQVSYQKSQICAQRKHPRPFISQWPCDKTGHCVSAMAKLNNTVNSDYMLLYVYIQLYFNIIHVVFVSFNSSLYVTMPHI